ncbi:MULTISPECIES: DUF4139 domain-containing protein [Rhodomicrobium]|uniref:DUF4139 domain-containing protein n=1 Tax=Rhodomicrobium TaxID=1068 RepID=UPI000B4A83B7|nr:MULTISPECIES: DUF4139 domain-containing protein [Rhodomicrobium]
MKRIVIAALAVSFSGSAMAEQLPLKRVVLSTAGLAQFTHAGEVVAGTTIDLSVRLDQVDDLLKSLTVFDQEGAIGGVSLPGKAPLAELFRDLPFGPEALNSLPNLLNALVGSEIEIEGPVNAKGRVLRLEEVQARLPDDGGQQVQHRLTMMTEGGFVQAVLEELSAVRFNDENTRNQIDRALKGVAANRAKERRTLAINLLGRTTRPVGFSYVVAAPVWKTAYRLVLPPDAGGKARLQGWGVVENLTGSDWADVELALISGNPVALKQPLYTAFYVERPEIPVTTAQRIVPRRDDAEEAVPAPAPMAKGGVLRYSRLADKAEAPAARAMSIAQDSAPMPEEMGNAALAAEAEEATTQISYKFPEKVTLANGSTMMVPFVDREVAAARTWLYQPDTNARHPLAAVLLQNDSASALPAGIITAYDRTSDGRSNFVGDAQLPLTAKSTSKFVTFALDAKTDVRRTDNGIKQTRLGKVANGQLTVSVKSVRRIDYEITPPKEEDRDVVIDEVRPSGWNPVGDAAKIEQTAARLRLKVNAPKGQTTKASLGLERTDQEFIALNTLDAGGIEATLRGLENTSPALQQALAQLGAIVADINRAERRREAIEAEVKGVSEDQERIRKNLQAVGANSDLGRRYVEALKTQENRLDAVKEESDKLDEEIAAKGEEAATVAKTLVL